ncbi:hypothetical protein LZ31DRAFT_379925 [Colletotrichum somersetense]|nr:hypothetical protein LZ31DRAFT_379925 [Colletotrichum somersetense]
MSSSVRDFLPKNKACLPVLDSHSAPRSHSICLWLLCLIVGRAPFTMNPRSWIGNLSPLGSTLGLRFKLKWMLGICDNPISSSAVAQPPLTIPDPRLKTSLTKH